MTILDKEISRECTVTKDGKPIIITIGDDQKIHLKLKHLKSEPKAISIEDVYDQLYDTSVKIKKTVKSDDEQYKQPDKKIVNVILHDIRNHNLISNLSYTDKVKFEAILKNLIDNYGY